MDIVVIAFLTAVGFFIIMVKIGLRKFLKFGAMTDLIITGVITVLFVGTFSGIVTGIIAGIFISFFLTFAKLLSKFSASLHN
jgi:hypothetical protein